MNPEYSLEGLRTDAEDPILWPPDAKSWLVGKDPDAGKDRRQKEKGAAEDEIIRWHRQPNEQTLGDGGGREAWCATVHRVTKSWTQFSDSTTATTIH